MKINVSCFWLVVTLSTYNAVMLNGQDVLRNVSYSYRPNLPMCGDMRKACRLINSHLKNG